MAFPSSRALYQICGLLSAACSDTAAKRSMPCTQQHLQGLGICIRLTRTERCSSRGCLPICSTRAFPCVMTCFYVRVLSSIWSDDDAHMPVLKYPGVLCPAPREEPKGLGLHNSIRATDHDPALGHICLVPMPACILSARINDVTLQAIYC